MVEDKLRDLLRDWMEKVDAYHRRLAEFGRGVVIDVDVVTEKMESREW